MALAGSVVTQDMDFNTIYAGTPARAISNRAGPQFEPPTTESRFAQMESLIAEFATLGGDPSKLVVVIAEQDVSWSDERSYFVLESRTYTKKHSEAEVAFMRFLLPERAKFTPLVRP